MSSPIIYEGDLGPFDSPSRFSCSLPNFRGMVNLFGLPVRGLDRLTQAGWALTLDPDAKKSHTPFTGWGKFWQGRQITLSMSQMFPVASHSLLNIATCTSVVYHECTHAYLVEFEDEISDLKSRCEAYYGNRSLAGGKTEDPWLIMHESGAWYVGDVVFAFSMMFFANNALRNGLNYLPPGSPDPTPEQAKNLVLRYITEFRTTVARRTFGVVGDDETAIVKEIFPDLRTFLGSAILSQLEQTGLSYASMFSSEIAELYPDAASQ